MRNYWEILTKKGMRDGRRERRSTVSAWLLVTGIFISPLTVSPVNAADTTTLNFKGSLTWDILKRDVLNCPHE